MSNLLDEWLPRVYRFALRLCQDRHIAEDLSQDTMLRACRHEGRLREPAAIRVWLFRIAANLWLDRLRRGQTIRFEGLDDQPLSLVPSPDRNAANEEELAKALNAMNGLPARQREVLYLNACEGMSSAEIGEVLAISPESVKASLSLARKRMRELLADIDPAPNQMRVQ